jgi:hypothetical protein
MDTVPIVWDPACVDWDVASAVFHETERNAQQGYKTQTMDIEVYKPIFTQHRVNENWTFFIETKGFGI